VRFLRARPGINQAAKSCTRAKRFKTRGSWSKTKRAMFKIRNVVPICSGRLRDFPSYGLWHCSIFWLVSWSNMALAATAHLGFAGIYARQTNKWLVTYVVSICWKLKMLWHILCVSVTSTYLLLKNARVTLLNEGWVRKAAVHTCESPRKVSGPRHVSNKNGLCCIMANYLS